MSVARRFLPFLPFAVALAFWAIIRTPIIDADTPGYLANRPIRTATYPLFLDLFHGAALLPLQLFLLAAAASWLAIYAQRFLPLLIVCGLVLAIIGNPYVWQLQSSIMTEALTTPLLVLIAGCLIAYCFKPSTLLLVVVVLLGGLATTIRPTLLPLIIAPLLAVWIAPGERLKMSAIAALLWLAPVSIERIYSRAVHGDRLTSPIGRNLFMKAAVIDAPPSGLNDPFNRMLERDYAPVRAILDQSRGATRQALLANYEACAGYPCANFLLPAEDEPALHRHMFEAGATRLARNPTGYVGLVVEDYAGQWLLHPRKILATDYEAFLARHQPMPFAAQVGEGVRPAPERSSIYAVNRAVFAALGLLDFLLPMIFLFYRPNALARASFVLLTGAQAVLIAGAFFANGQARYPMGLWPLLVSGIILGGAGLIVASPAGRRYPPSFLQRPAIHASESAAASKS